MQLLLKLEQRLPRVGQALTTETGHVEMAAPHFCKQSKLSKKAFIWADLRTAQFQNLHGLGNGQAHAVTHVCDNNGSAS